MLRFIFSGKPGIFFSGKPGIGPWEARDFFFWEARDWLLGSQGFCLWIIYKIGKISSHSITVGTKRKLSKVIRGILTSLKTSNLLNSSLTESFWNRNLIFEGRNWIIYKIGRISAHSITVGTKRKLFKVIRGLVTSLKTSNLLNSSLNYYYTQIFGSYSDLQRIPSSNGWVHVKIY